MGVAYNPSIVTNGLVLYLDAANNRSYPGTGTAWSDLSGNGYNGTLVNSPTFSTSNNGVINFTGANDYVNLGNPFEASTNFTIVVWVKNSSSGQGGMFTKGEVNDSTEWGLSFGFSNPLLIVARCRGTAQALSASWVPYTTGYHQISYSVIGSSSSRLFVDGVQVASNTLSISPAATIGNLQIAFHGTSYYFNDSIASVLYYNRALSSEEISQNFNAIRGRFGI